MEKTQTQLYFKTASSVEEFEACYRLRYQVYCEEKQWLNPDNFPSGLEKDSYDEKATHVMAYDEDFQLVGMMRILRSQDFAELPYQHHPGMKGRPVMAKNTAELSRFMVTARKNRMEITRGLVRAVYQTSLQLGVENWVILIEPSLRRLLSMLDFIFEPLCNPVKYYGGFTEIAMGNIKRSENMWRAEKPEALNYYMAEDAVILQSAMAG